MKELNSWSTLGELEKSRYQTKRGVGTRPTLKTLKDIDSTTRAENIEVGKGLIDEEARALSFINDQNMDYRNRALEENNMGAVSANISTIRNDESKAKGEPVLNKSSTIINVSDVKNDDIKENVKDIFMGLGKMYMDKTNNILKPLRFVMNNKTIVLKAFMLFVVPGFMAWYFTTNIESVRVQLAQETIVMKAIYNMVFYFASMFILFTGLVISLGLVNACKELLKYAKEVGKEK